MSAAARHLPPALRDRFQDPEILGVGSYAVVLKARDMTRDEPVALKLASPSDRLAPALRAQLAARFGREATLAARLDHENVVRVLDSGEADGRPYLVQEFVPGADLRQALEDRPDGFTPDEAAVLVRQLLAGLAAAHAAGIQHRDLKPANLLVTPGGALKIADFGLAKAADSAQLTQKGGRAGSPAYTAPEVFRGAEPDARADVYAAGVIYLELLTGRTPFEALDLPDLYRAKAAPPALDWGPRGAAVPGAVRAFVAATLRPDPADRPPDAAVAARRFAAACRGEVFTRGAAALRARPVTAPSPARRAAALDRAPRAERTAALRAVASRARALLAAAVAGLLAVAAALALALR